MSGFECSTTSESESETTPDFYDPEFDERAAQRVASLRGGRSSDAILSCPCCFTTVCIECKQQDLQNSRSNLEFTAERVLHCWLLPHSEVGTMHTLCCAVCKTKIGWKDDHLCAGVYHFTDVIASQS